MLYPTHQKCPECKTNHEIMYDEKDCIIYCNNCHLVLAASYDYAAGEHVDLPWGIILK